MPARRPITIEDLLSFRMGFGSKLDGAPRAPTPSKLPRPKQTSRAPAARPGLREIPRPRQLDQDALGSLPLMYQPGEQWLYNTGTQVLGVLLARATGQDLPSLFGERIFGPLGMADTGFIVPAASLPRLTTAYQTNPQTGETTILDDPAHSFWSTPSLPDASGWLVSTIDDYWKFVSMLLAGGTAGDDRIISPAGITLMTMDRLTPAQRAASTMFLGPHGGWGLGLAVPATGAGDQPFPCGVGWDGGTGTTWRSNLQRGVTAILLPRSWLPPHRSHRNSSVTSWCRQWSAATAS